MSIVSVIGLFVRGNSFICVSSNSPGTVIANMRVFSEIVITLISLCNKIDRTFVNCSSRKMLC